MKLEKGKISFLVSNGETTIEITDASASVNFVKVTLTNEQLAQMLSRLMYTECEVEVFGLERVGMYHQNTDFVFDVPEGTNSSSKGLPEMCRAAMDAAGLQEWVADNYYQGQHSFFTVQGQRKARITIRRWVDKKEISQ